VLTIAEWLASLGLSDYTQRFVENDIDVAVLPDLTDKHLKDLGVSIGHRLRILRAIRELGVPSTAQITNVTPAQQQDRAERRRLTVMFCDLVGSTELSQRLDPEDFTDLIRSYRETCSRSILDVGGSIGRFLGDGILAYFGYPHAHEDDAARACRAGLGIIEAIDRQQVTSPLQVRIACATGLALVGDIVGEGVVEAKAIMGATPNLAAKLQAIAAPGTLLVSDETHLLMGDLFEQEDLGLHDLKGVTGPVRAWRVVRERRHESRFAARVQGRPLDLVGRQPELDLLLSRWSSARMGRGQIVLVSGEPGIGKSRLLHALRECVTLETSTTLIHQCSAFHQTTALYPFIEPLERVAFNFRRDDTAAHKLEKLEAWLEAYGFEPAEAAPLFANLMSIPTGDRYPPPTASPERRKQQTLDALVRMILSWADKRPVLLAVEDLHWADPTTLEMLGLLLDRTASARFMAILTYRPEFRPPWTTHTSFAEITLNRLNPEASSAMVELIAGGRSMPAEVREQIITKTDGVPLFVEELTKTVIESGLLQEVGDRFELSGPLIPLALPTTLSDSLMARLDRLGSAKAMAQAFAILGRDFSYELLRAVFPSPDATLIRDLDQLVAAELLCVSGTPPDAMYSFKHALIHEAAYESLLRRTRQEYHERVAHVLIEQFPNTSATRPEVIAQHLTKGGLAAQAIPFWTQAAQTAMQRSANLEAISHLTNALELLNSLPETEQREQQELTLRALLAIPLTLTRGWAAPEVGTLYRRASELSSKYGNTPKLFPTLVGVLTYYLVRGQFRTAYEMGQRNWEVAQRIGEPELILEAEVDRGTTSFYLGHFEECVSHLERVGRLYDPSIHHHHVFAYGKDPGAVALIHKSHALWCLGYPDQAKRAAAEAKALTERWIHPFSDIWSRIGLAFGHQVRGEAAEVVKVGESIVGQSIEQVFPNWLAQGMVFRGWGVAYLGDPDQGINFMRQGLDLWAKTGAELRKTYFLSLLADACIRAGQLTDALEVIDTALDQVTRSEEHFWEAELHRQRGETLLLLRKPDAAGAQASFMHALEVARTQKQRSLELRAATDLARLWQIQGRTGKARALLEPVYSWFTEGLDTHDLVTARTALEAFDMAIPRASNDD
jgi:class 3 adenylate cyclase/predicted ATPase